MVEEEQMLRVSSMAELAPSDCPERSTMLTLCDSPLIPHGETESAVLRIVGSNSFTDALSVNTCGIYMAHICLYHKSHRYS